MEINGLGYVGLLLSVLALISPTRSIYDTTWYIPGQSTACQSTYYMSMITNLWITKLKFSFQAYQGVPQWKQFTERLIIHKSSSPANCPNNHCFSVCFKVHCKVKTNMQGDPGLFTMSKLLLSFLYWQNTQSSSLASWTFQACNYHSGPGRCYTPTTSRWTFSDTMHFLKDMCICCLQDCQRRPNLPQDTYLLSEVAIIWISIYIPQGGNVELNKQGWATPRKGCSSCCHLSLSWHRINPAHFPPLF